MLTRFYFQLFLSDFEVKLKYFLDSSSEENVQKTSKCLT